MFQQREIRDLEDGHDLQYKNLTLAQDKLRMAEERYKKQNFANLRDEKMQVAEIDRIKRNLAKLAKYIPMIEERKAIEVITNGLRLEIRAIRLRMRSCRDKIHFHRKHISDLKTPYIMLKRRLFEINEEKRCMIQQYEQDRQSYALAQQNVGVIKAVRTYIVF